MAIESLRNIADVKIREKSSQSDNPEDPDVERIVDILRDAGASLAVTEIAGRLQWDSDRTANALARGGQSGVLKFTRDQEDRTTVALAQA
jgi:hypothetical protein